MKLDPETKAVLEELSLTEFNAARAAMEKLARTPGSNLEPTEAEELLGEVDEIPATLYIRQ